MVNINSVIASNTSSLSSLGSGLVAVFVGATSGIGETTAREFIRLAKSPKVYLIGRSAPRAQSLLTELRTLNPSANLTFLSYDISLLKNVDAACAQIIAAESKLNLLFMSPGVMTTRGRNPTTENLDLKFSLHYYARMRFVQKLLPLLSATPKSSSVVSVLAAGLERPLKMDDLSLARPGSFSLKACADHATTMNSLALQLLAERNPGVSFVHSAPGGVRTNLMRDFNPVMRGMAALLTGVLFMLPIPGLVGQRESGQRHVYAATSDVFQANGKAHLIGWSGERTGNEKLFKEMEESGGKEQVWAHTEDVFEQIEKGGRYDPESR